jgi:hypothetical protein
VRLNSSLNAGPNPEEKTSEPSDTREEISALRELLNVTRLEMLRSGQRMERRQDEVDAKLRHNRALWIVVVLIAMEFAAGLWFGIPLLRDRGAFAAWFPAKHAVAAGVPEIQSSDVLKDGTTESEPSRSGDGGGPTLQGAAKSGNDSAAGLPVQPAQPNKASEANETKDNGNPIDHTQLDKTANIGAVSTRNGNVNSSNTDARLLTDTSNKKRIDFELSRNQTQEVAPGIYLTVKNTDVENQRIEGWIQIAEEGRTVWIRDQGAQKTISFATAHDLRSCVLVFTRIGKSGAAGYLLVPKTAG